MTAAHSQALDQALAALRAPGLYLRLREAPLPDDLLFLLRLAAGESQSRELASEISGEPPGVVVEAAVLFIQQVMFYPGGDSHRLLGVSLASPDSQVKEHHRWLVRWLHPDRNTDQWDAVYADRVNRAWQDLRTPERRREYEAQLPAAPPFVDWQPEKSVLANVHPPGNWPDDEFTLSSRTTRRLPMLIMGGLVIGAITILGLQYQLTRKQTRNDSAVITSSTTPATVSAEAPSRPIANDLDRVAQLPPPNVVAPEPPAALAPLAVSHAPVTPVAPAPVVLIAEARPAVASRVRVEVAPSAPAKVRLATTPARESLAMQTPNTDRPLRETEKTRITQAQAPAMEPVAVREARQAQETPRAGAAEVAIPAAAPPPPPPPLIDAAIARQVIMRFRSAYSSGNINQFRDLLARSTLDNPGERKMILRTYSKLFETSARRRIEIHDPDWLTDGDTAVLIARYDAWIVPRGDSQERHFFGNIRFDLLNEGGELRVARLRHDSAGG